MSASNGWPAFRSATSTRSASGVVVLGGGNTAMDCCRTALRLGGVDVKVIVRSGFAEMKASPWEKEDAMHEGVAILNYHRAQGLHARKRPPDRRGLREGRRPRKDADGRRVLVPTGEPDVHIPCDDVLIAVGQENAFPWIERDAGVAFGRDGLPAIDPRHLPVEPASGVLRRRFRASARRTSSPRSRMATRRRSRSTPIAGARICGRGPPPMTNLVSQKMGIHEWSYDNAITLDRRFAVPHVESAKALQEH